jgi:hypothetical protein
MRHNTQNNPQPWYNCGADGGARTHNLRFRRLRKAYPEPFTCVHNRFLISNLTPHIYLLVRQSPHSWL